MALLITLALFLWIGGSIAKGTDKAADRRFLRGDANLKQLQSFLANFYVVWWYFYQQMEPQAIQQWENSEYFVQGADPLGHPNNIVNWNKVQQRVFGTIAFEKSAQVAFQQMLEHGCDMFVPNPNPQQSKQYGMSLIPYRKGMEVNPDKASSAIQREGYDKMPHLYDYFDFEFAANATDPWVISLMPEIDDPRAAHYTAGGCVFTRRGTPLDYTTMVDRVRQHSGEPPQVEQTKQEFQISV